MIGGVARRDVQDLGGRADRVAGVVAGSGRECAAEDGLVALRELAGHGTAMIPVASALHVLRQVRHATAPRRNLLGRPVSEAIDEVRSVALQDLDRGTTALAVCYADPKQRMALFHRQLV